MNLLLSKNAGLRVELPSDRTEYTFCLRCRTVNRIEVERRYGVLQEFHENGSCLIRHPNWLIGRYPNVDEAKRALMEKLSELVNRSSHKHFWLGRRSTGEHSTRVLQ